MTRDPALTSVSRQQDDFRSPVLPPSWQARFAPVLERAVRKARQRGAGTLASLTVSLRAGADPSGIALCSRLPGEAWFLFEQPERDRRALAALGEAARLQDSGAGRFERTAARWRELVAMGVSESEAGHGEGPLAIGGFAFADEGGRSPGWAGFAPACLSVPELALVRVGEKARAILSLLVQPDDTPPQLLARMERRVQALRSAPIPLLDPEPTGRFLVSSAMPPEHYEAAVLRAKELIDRGQIEKIVLAREVDVQAPRPYDPGAIFGVLREAFGGCFVFCVGRGESVLIAASPELLVRREGQRVSTLALAGSTRRSADPAVDDHLGEQLLQDASYREEHAIVARRIERALRPHSVWVTAPREPRLARIANIQHLATPIRAQLAAPIDATVLAGLMHPTPAIGGEPLSAALRLIPALEGFDRGWYSGPVGWTDATGDGEFCVALRCALLRGSRARCYAGNGIVRDSDPAAELAETEIKLAALLPLLAG